MFQVLPATRLKVRVSTLCNFVPYFVPLVVKFFSFTTKVTEGNSKGHKVNQYCPYVRLAPSPHRSLAPQPLWYLISPSIGPCAIVVILNPFSSSTSSRRGLKCQATDPVTAISVPSGRLYSLRLRLTNS